METETLDTPEVMAPVAGEEEAPSALRWHAALRDGTVLSEPTKIALKKALVDVANEQILVICRGSIIPLVTRVMTTF